MFLGPKSEFSADRSVLQCQESRVRWNAGFLGAIANDFQEEWKPVGQDFEPTEELLRFDLVPD